MIQRILIDYQGDMVRTAMVCDARLHEIFIDHTLRRSHVGSIINGVVRSILPSRFAFIDIGQNKNAFMNLPDEGDFAKTLRPGQFLPVQVKKDATGSKGANVSRLLQFKGGLAILQADTEGTVGCSQKITDKAERKRLRQLAHSLLPPGFGCVLRTQSAGASEADLQAELSLLAAQYADSQKKALHAPGLAVLHRENALFTDWLTPEIHEIIVNDAAAFEDIRGRVPDFAGRVRLWEDEEPLFSAYDLERQILAALRRDVWLPCGGNVTFDQTEACVVVDVNTGKFEGKKNYRETALRTNLEAAKCIAGQITLRNLSGMIIVDFIDMHEADKPQLIAAFSQALKQDRIPADIVGMTELGLMQLTRRKKREPLSRLLQQSCECCKGTGRVSINLRS